MIEQSFDARGNGIIGIGNDGEEGDCKFSELISDAWINRTTLNGVVDERFRLEANGTISLYARGWRNDEPKWRFSGYC